MNQLSHLLMPSIVAKLVGWKVDSGMGRVYHHTTDQDIEDTILGLYRLVKSSNIHILGTKKCVECQHINLGIVTSFQKCGSLLEEKHSEESINVEKLESEEKT